MEKKENRPQHKTICKPFKETGYCGYGDTCKYAHERFVDYEDVSSEHASCLYCKSSFREPVTTLCGHIFCSCCAVEIFLKMTAVLSVLNQRWGGLQ